MSTLTTKSVRRIALFALATAAVTLTGCFGTPQASGLNSSLGQIASVGAIQPAAAAAPAASVAAPVPLPRPNPLREANPAPAPAPERSITTPECVMRGECA